MAGNIKGITIEFSGETTKLDKALRQIKNSTKDIDRELKNVDKALKFNPTNVDLWRQKQDLLKDKIAQTESNLKELKNTQAQLDAKGVDKNSEAYRTVQREIIEADSKLKHFKSELRQIGNANLKAAAEQVKQLGSNLEEAGRKMQGLSAAAGVVAGALGALAVKSGQWADDLNTMSKQYSLSTGELQKYSAAADLVDVSTETIAKSHVKLERSMLSASKGTGASAEAFEALGVKVTNADGSLRDSDAVWQDTIAALGQLENETERDAYAMQLMGKSATDLNPLIEDGGETYKRVAETFEKYGLDYVDQETLDKANEFNDLLDTMKMVGLVTLQNLGAELAGYLVPALEKVVEWVGKAAQWLSSLSPEVLTIIGVVAAVVAGLAPVLIILGKLATGISAIINLVGVVGPIIGGLAGPVGIAIAIIAALVAIGVVLYKNWDKIKAKAIELKDRLVTAFNDLKAKVTATFNAIKDAIVKPIQTAFDKFKAIVDKIKGFFPINVGKILGKIQLPHFKLSGKFSLKDMTVPKLSVDWYKTGGIFNSANVIGVGEAGPEAVVPLDKFWDKLEHMQQGETNIVININGGTSSPTEIAAAVKRELIQEVKRGRLAWQ